MTHSQRRTLHRPPMNDASPGPASGRSPPSANVHHAALDRDRIPDFGYENTTGSLDISMPLYGAPLFSGQSLTAALTPARGTHFNFLRCVCDPSGRKQWIWRLNAT